MGQQMGVVALVDSLAVLREQSIWRQNGTDWDVPRRPDKFKLSGEYCLRDVFTLLGTVYTLRQPGTKPAYVGFTRIYSGRYPGTLRGYYFLLF